MMPLSASASEAERFLDRDVSGPRLDQLRLREPVSVDGVRHAELRSKVHPSLRGAVGMRQVVVKLRGPSVGDMTDQDRWSRISRKHQLEAEQAEFIRRGQGRAAMRVQAQTQMVLNAVFANVEGADLDELAEDPAVERIVPVANYEMHLSETVPYIGAAAVQADGYDGEGVRVAVLDSGIDYLHANLGGSGDPAEYAANDPTVIEPGTFPTAKVVGGYDFVGSNWPDVEFTEPDEDPLDDGPEAGHGTHVADIIGGMGGVAPGVELYAVKVCSSVSTSCSGVALIEGMEWAVDPDGDGDTSDAVDIINMSLGSDYGQPFDDDLAQAVEAAAKLGVLTVASAGNGADKPYVTGTPSSTPSALSVAQTQVPSAALQLISEGDNDYPAVFQPWSAPLTETISGPLQYGDGAGGNLNGCAPFAAGSLDGMVVLVDRGACNFTLKIFNIDQAGGVVGIIGLVAPGAPFSGGDGGDGPITIPGYMINQADSAALQAAAGSTVTVDPENQLALVGQMVGSSSRGPQHESTTLIKPEIGAPGASVSAVAGSGDGTGPFGGTSGAAPMVSGAAALVMQAVPFLGADEVKARLVNNGEVNIDTDPFTGLAPITRIGGGEVRVADAVSSHFAAWDTRSGQPALSFGFRDVERRIEVDHKKLRVRNYSNQSAWLRVTPTFRYGDDEANGAVKVLAPRWIRVRPKGDAIVPVVVKIDGEALRENAMTSGPDGTNPDTLTFNEYDGYLELTGAGETIRVPWHILPRKAASVVGRSVLDFDNDMDQITLVNRGVGTAQVDGYSLLAISPNLPEGDAGEQSPTPDIRGVGVNTFPVDAGFCSAEPSFVWAFAINTWERQQHVLPVSHQVALDVDRDGEDDYVVLNRDLSGLNTIGDGRQVTYAVDLAAGTASAFFFTEHSTNTGNTVLLICGEQVGLTGTDMLNTLVDVDVIAQDFYYGGPGDLVEGLTITPLGEQYFATTEDIPGRSLGSLTVQDFGQFPGTSEELGIMLVTNGDRGAGLRGGATQRTEAMFIYTQAALPGLPQGGRHGDVKHDREDQRDNGRNAWRD